MKRNLAIIYLIVYAVMITYSSLTTSPIPIQQMNDIVGVQIHSCAFACMFAYISHYQFKKLSWFPKVVAVILVIYDLISFCVDVLTLQNHYSYSILVAAVVSAVFLAIPSWYMCFKYAFLQKK